ncbi:MAG: hypothetical protein BWX96_02955 [Bacteroidetes bacterium ADurb.Bin145]|jgi:hypothetical protein|nr:MAG: hypothetical protein BWX96_02955 [Bacteroidetes bacterium ADurb.Bin145]
MNRYKKILLVSNGFFPEISPRSYRATELAKEFFRQGHEVTVISKYRDYNYSDFLKEYPITFKMWGKFKLPTVPDFRKKYLSVFVRGLSRFLSLLFEYPAIEDMFKVKKMLRDESGYDIIISFAVPYPVHWGVAWAMDRRKQNATKWVADCGDPYMGDVLDTFRKPFYFAYLEKWFCRRADFISIPIEKAKPGYYSEFHHKIRIIPQGFDFDLKKEEVSGNKNPVPTFAYAGTFLQGARNPEPLMHFLADFDFQFKFLVFTNKPDILEKYKFLLHEKLIVSDYIPRQELMEVLKKMDFLINFDNNTELNSPSKLIDYAIAQRPVLNITKDFNGEDLKAFLRGDYSNQMLLPDINQYHIRNISHLFLDLLES